MVNKKERQHIKANEQIVLDQHDFYMLLLSTVRYALGRRTYIVGWICNKVSVFSPKLLPQQRKVLIKEIIDYGKRGGDYGMEFDKEEWMALLKLLKALPRA